MPNNSYFIDLYNNELPPLAPISAEYTGPFILGLYTSDIFTSRHYFHAFLHNPVNSNKIIKIKNLDYKYTVNGFNGEATNIRIERASAVNSSFIEPYEKLDTNAPDLPANVGLTVCIPIGGYTSTGVLRNTPTPPKPNKSFSVPIFNFTNSKVIPHFDGQKTLTTCQDITLNANQHIVISHISGPSSIRPVNTKYQIGVLFSSGSNTYYQTSTTTNTNLQHYDNQTPAHPAAFVNNSNTTIKIHKIEVGLLYGDGGYYQGYGGTIGQYNTRAVFFLHAYNNQISPSLTEDLINSDVHEIISLDSTNTLPAGIKCYKNSVRLTAPTSQQQFGGSNDLDMAVPIGLARGRYWQSGNQSTGLQNTTTNAAFLRLNHYSGTTKSQLNYNKPGQEIIIYPGEGLGFLTYSSAAQDFADGAPFGHIIFTVEDIPSNNAVVETGFGY